MEGDSTFKAGMGPGQREEVREQHPFSWESPEHRRRSGLCTRSGEFLLLTRCGWVPGSCLPPRPPLPGVVHGASQAH